jgi:FHA domain
VTAAATEPLLGILKYILLALLYLFFARVLWAVWSEVRGPRHGTAVPQTAHATAGSSDPTLAAPPPIEQATKHSKRAPRAPKGKRGSVGRLVVKVRSGSAFPLADEITIGRAATCTIGMPDDTFVSQLHARVFRDASSTIIEDLGSTNGTYLNGKRVTGAERITKGDRVQIGSTLFEAE